MKTRKLFIGLIAMCISSQLLQAQTTVRKRIDELPEIVNPTTTGKLPVKVGNVTYFVTVDNLGKLVNPYTFSNGFTNNLGTIRLGSALADNVTFTGLEFNMSFGTAVNRLKNVNLYSTNGIILNDNAAVSINAPLFNVSGISADRLDTSTFKPMGYDASGNLVRFKYWPMMANASILNNITQAKVDAWDAGGDDAHTHDNMETLDDISADRATIWDAKYGNDDDNGYRRAGDPITGALWLRTGGPIRDDITGTDATGQIPMRGADGFETRIPVGANGTVMTVVNGVPTFAATGGGVASITLGASTLFTSTTFTGSAGAWTGTPTLANQTQYTVLGNHSGASAAPTFGKLPVQSISAGGTTYDGSKFLRDDGTWATAGAAYTFNTNDFTNTSNAIAANKGFAALTISAGTTTHNRATGEKKTLTLPSGNTTLAITNAQSGDVGYIEFTQPASGAAGTVTLPAGSRVAGGGGGILTLSATNGAVDGVAWRYNGTNYIFWFVFKNAS